MAAALVTAIGLAPAANAQEKEQPLSYEQFRAAKGRIAAQYLGDHLDYRKYGEEMRVAGAQDIRISNPDLGIKDATPEQAQVAYQGYVRERAGVPEGSSMVPLAVPIDAFTVQTIASTFSVSGGWYDDIELHWNFRDNYVNGSAPDDAAAIALDDYDFSCYERVSTWKESYTWDNSVRTSDNYVWLENVTPDTAVFRLRDTVSGFVLNVDHGFVAMSLARPNSPPCSNPLQRITASGWYEHNQDGNGSWTVGIGWGFFELEYTGNPGARLQKAGGIDTLR